MRPSGKVRPTLRLRLDRCLLKPEADGPPEIEIPRCEPIWILGVGSKKKPTGLRLGWFPGTVPALCKWCGTTPCTCPGEVRPYEGFGKPAGPRNPSDPDLDIDCDPCYPDFSHPFPDINEDGEPDGSPIPLLKPRPPF